jgi:hypothetical protein
MPSPDRRPTSQCGSLNESLVRRIFISRRKRHSYRCKGSFGGIDMCGGTDTRNRHLDPPPLAHRWPPAAYRCRHVPLVACSARRMFRSSAVQVLKMSPTCPSALLSRRQVTRVPHQSRPRRSTCTLRPTVPRKKSQSQGGHFYPIGPVLRPAVPNQYSAAVVAARATPNLVTRLGSRAGWSQHPPHEPSSKPSSYTAAEIDQV